MRWKICLVLALIIGTPCVAHGQSDRLGRIVVFDLTTTRPDSFPRVVAIAYDPARNHGVLATLDTAAKASPVDSTIRDLVVAEARERGAGNRWLSRAGDSVVIFVLHDINTVARIQLRETERRTRIATDLRTLGRLALRIATAGAAGVAPEDLPPPRTILVTRTSHTLSKVRANLAITASAAARGQPLHPNGCQSAGSGTTPPPASALVLVCIADPPGTAAQTTQTVVSTDSTAKPNRQETSLVTGPAEHLFLGANAAATQLSELEYDDDSQSLQPRETPTSFTVGINYAFGDVLTSPEPGGDVGERLRNLFNGLYVGAAVQASRQPFDQLSAVAGLRYNPIPVLDRLVSFETMSPYVGVVWIREDRVDAAGNQLDERRYGKGAFVWGVSVNLDRALKWIGGN